MSNYPHSPGYKRAGTSKDAAIAITSRALTLRARCAVLFTDRYSFPYTADEVAEALGESVLSVRPRVTELYRMGLIEDSGMRRKNASGHNAIVWRVAKKQMELGV